MSTSNLTPPNPDTEPTAVTSSHSVWPFVALGLMLFGGLIYTDQRAGGFDNQVYEPFRSLDEVAALQPKGAGDEVYAKGRKVYQLSCQVCHQASGLGAPGQFPPLADSEWVLAESPNRIIRIVLNGLQGPIEVKGQPYNNAMVPWRDVLDDESIAAVLTYIRRQKDWKHSASEVKTELVKAIREKTKDRSEPWSGPEVLAIPLGND
jgi:mono/diheme cytochrome c family protein